MILRREEQGVNMKKLRPVGTIALSFLLLCPGLVSAESMRCGNRVISTGNTKAKVLITCGEPFLREVVEERGSAHTEGAIQKFGSGDSTFSAFTTSSLTAVEKWTYNLGSNQFLRILTFEGDKLVDIELGDKP